MVFGFVATAVSCGVQFKWDDSDHICYIVHENVAYELLE